MSAHKKDLTDPPIRTIITLKTSNRFKGGTRSASENQALKSPQSKPLNIEGGVRRDLQNSDVGQHEPTPAPLHSTNVYKMYAQPLEKMSLIGHVRTQLIGNIFVTDASWNVGTSPCYL
ncbi:uncharacterized protein LOC122395296 [Colletes gigas]|uniref:uncharacterized protein LOC122395296 n=1 Tax=Colletes gigas TaxID=935657 RepID=UPI001C9A93A0|nr:uncharacterized protein LOC122395296 [Colletes gigas]